MTITAARGADGSVPPPYPTRRTSLACVLLGMLAAAGFAPFYLYPLAPIVLAVLALLWLRAPTARRAAWLGACFGLGFFLAGVSWVYISMNVFGAMPPPLAAGVTLLFCAYLALFPATAGYLFATLPVSPATRLVLVLPATWTLLEWLRSWLFTGFPWLGMGYSQIPGSPLAGYAPLLGIYGITLAVVAGAGLLALLYLQAAPEAGTLHQRRKIAVLSVAALLFITATGEALRQIAWTRPAGEPLTISLLQGNIPQDLKWHPDHVSGTLATYRELALASSSRLIILPETALPLFLREVPAEFLNEMATHARRHDGDILLGVPELLADGRYYNSLVSVGSAPSQVYRKVHLVPFGEFIPLRPLLSWVVNTFAIPLQDFSAGHTDQRPLTVAGQRVAINICYEDAFGEEIIRQLPEATLLVNVSNVAWFGDSIAPPQHLQISQARALETGRYMLRATNTGMTAVINPRGKVERVAPDFSRAVLTHEVTGYEGATPYVRWGNAAALALCVILLGIAALRARRRLHP